MNITCISLILAIALWGAEQVYAREHRSQQKPSHQPQVVYQDRTQLDFEGTQIEGELNNSSEFYFQHKPDEKMDSLVKRRKNFRREMLRDVVLSK